MIQKRSRLIVTLLVLVGIIILGVLLFQYTFIQSYPAFLEQERKSESQFEKLNLTVFQNFPPPPGVSERTRSSRLLSQYNHYSHGVRLEIQYDIEQGSIEQVLQYYEDLLKTQHWTQKDNEPWDWSWYHQKSCFELDYHKKSEYTVDIWHDYLSQPFSPRMPFSIAPGLILGFHELFETIIDECP